MLSYKTADLLVYFAVKREAKHLQYKWKQTNQSCITRYLAHTMLCITNPIILGGETLEEKTFTYLDMSRHCSIMDGRGRSDAVVKTNIGKRRTAF